MRVGQDQRNRVHAANPQGLALCNPLPLASCVLSGIHEQRVEDGDLCGRCQAMIRAARDEGTTVVSA